MIKGWRIISYPLYNRRMHINDLDKILTEYTEGENFSPAEFEVSAQSCESWVRFKSDPQRFVPKIFDGDWAYTQQHPQPGKLRIVRIMTGTDGISRAIARQGNKIYAYPWFK